MNITINQITNQQETVQNTVLSKILAAKRNNGTVNLTGNIYISAAYADEVQEFCTYFGLTEDENSPGTYRGNNIILSIGTSYISFQDNEVARIILANFGTDGHITLQQAADVVFTSSTFKNNTTITAFPEFDLFTKANINPPNDLFYGCVNLEDIDMSKVSIINTNEFRQTKLQSISLPSSVTKIGSGAFYGCSSLSSITLPSSLFTIDSNAFYGCSNLTSLDLSTVTAIGKDAFRECPNLTSIKIGPSVNKLTYRALAGIPAQPNTVLYLPLITTSAESEQASISDSHYSTGCFSYNAFGEYSSQSYTNSVWGQIYLPNLTHPSGGWCAHPNYMAPLSSIDADLIYLKNISSLGVGMFGGSRLKALVINSTTPPPLTRSDQQNWDSFTRLMQADGIYVPDGYESVYTTAWANVNPPETFNNSTQTYIDILSKIKPMSQLSRYATEQAWITAGRPVALIEEYMS